MNKWFRRIGFSEFYYLIGRIIKRLSSRNYSSIRMMGVFELKISLYPNNNKIVFTIIQNEQSENAEEMDFRHASFVWMRRKLSFFRMLCYGRSLVAGWTQTLTTMPYCKLSVLPWERSRRSLCFAMFIVFHVFSAIVAAGWS